MGFLESRLFRLFQPAQAAAQPSQQIADLRHTLLSAIQDIAVLKALLREKGTWDDALYQRLRVRQMIEDHSSAGPNPWTRHSYYPYTLDERDFLRFSFHAGDADVEDFARTVHAVETST